MRIAFFGTPDIALPSLEAMVSSAHDVVYVVTRPDRPSGRHREPNPPAVKRRSLDLGLEVLPPEKSGGARAPRLAAGVECLVIVAYGAWLPPSLLAVAPRGTVNMHPSLLPRWRGAAPVERAIMAGDAVTGVTTMELDEGLDTGPVYLQRETPIREDETAGDLSGRLAVLGAPLLVETVDGIAAGTLDPRPQAEAGVSYAEKLTPQECRIDWTRPADEVGRLVRGANPRPGAWTELAGRRLKVWRAAPVPDGHGTPGEVASLRPFRVAAGRGGLDLLEVQPDGRGRMGAEAFAAGHEVVGEQMV